MKQFQSQRNEVFSLQEQASQYYRDWYTYFMKLIINRVKWDGLPDDIPGAFIEKTLLSTGNGLFFNSYVDDDPLYVFTKVSGTGKIDIYGQPAGELNAMTDLWTRFVKEEDYVLLYNSYSRINSELNDVMLYARELAEYNTSVFSNVLQQRWGILISAPSGSDKDKANMARLLKNGEPYIMQTNDNGLESPGNISVSNLNVAADFKADRINSALQSRLGIMLSSFGISYEVRDKKSYLSNMEQGLTSAPTSLIRDDIMRQREMDVKRINERFGLNVSVEWNEEPIIFDTIVSAETDISNIGDDDNE